MKPRTGRRLRWVAADQAGRAWVLFGGDVLLGVIARRPGRRFHLPWEAWSCGCFVGVACNAWHAGDMLLKEHGL